MIVKDGERRGGGGKEKCHKSLRYLQNIGKVCLQKCVYKVFKDSDQTRSFTPDGLPVIYWIRLSLSYKCMGDSFT